MSHKQRIPKTNVTALLLIALTFMALVVESTLALATAQAACFPDLPRPNLQLKLIENYTGSDGRPYTRYQYTITNRAA